MGRRGPSQRGSSRGEEGGRRGDTSKFLASTSTASPATPEDEDEDEDEDKGEDKDQDKDESIAPHLQRALIEEVRGGGGPPAVRRCSGWGAPW